MRVCAVICEYNPFHLGHAYHLRAAREASGADYVLCLMSGALTQRGAFARHDKWLRARAALENGADIVLELPARFACSPAPDFAGGGVALLAALGVVTHLSFGCEPSALPLLSAAASLFKSESPDFSAALQRSLADGLPYPRARALAAVPSPEALRAAEESGFVHEEEALTQALLYRLRTASPAELAALYGMDEGLENRFIAAAQTCSTRETLLDCVKTRRYTRARLSRLCAYALLNLTRDFAQTHRVPDYARVLGFRKSAAPLLKTINQRSSIPLITKAANFDRSNPLFALDVLAQDLWSLGVSNPSLRASGRDFTTSPAILSR